jgi:hypothetical protein
MITAKEFGRAAFINFFAGFLKAMGTIGNEVTLCYVTPCICKLTNFSFVIFVMSKLTQRHKKALYRK